MEGKGLVRFLRFRGKERLDVDLGVGIKFVVRIDFESECFVLFSSWGVLLSMSGSRCVPCFGHLS